MGAEACGARQRLQEMELVSQLVTTIVTIRGTNHNRGALEEGAVSCPHFWGDTISPSESAGLTVEEVDLSGIAGTNVVSDAWWA